MGVKIVMRVMMWTRTAETWKQSSSPDRDLSFAGRAPSGSLHLHRGQTLIASNLNRTWR